LAVVVSLVWLVRQVCLDFVVFIIIPTLRATFEVALREVMDSATSSQAFRNDVWLTSMYSYPSRVFGLHGTGSQILWWF
jgi:hypothetical protein